VLYPSGPLLEVLTYWCLLALQHLLAFGTWMVCRPLRSCRMLGRVLVSHCSPACLPIYLLTPRSQIHHPILMVSSTRPSYSLCNTSSTCRIHHSFPDHCYLPLLGVSHTHPQILLESTWTIRTPHGLHMDSTLHKDWVRITQGQPQDWQ
jgi:hypothetical protein